MIRVIMNYSILLNAEITRPILLQLVRGILQRIQHSFQKFRQDFCGRWYEYYRCHLSGIW